MTEVAVIVPFESAREPSIDPLVDLVAADMERVNAAIIGRTGSEVTMIPEVANHLINSGGKRLRPMLTLALSRLAGYGGHGHIKLAAYWTGQAIVGDHHIDGRQRKCLGGPADAPFARIGEEDNAPGHANEVSLRSRHVFVHVDHIQ